MYNIKKFLSSVVVLTTFLLTTSAFAMEAKFTDMPEDAMNLVVKQAAYEQFLGEKKHASLGKTLCNLTLVCKGWQSVINREMKVDTPSWKEWYGVTPKNEHIYQQFLTGQLICRPSPESDEGMITLKISELIDPLSCTFDLSTCGDAGQHLSISTGYRKGQKPENRNKVQIWIAPRFMIEKNLKSSVGRLQYIMDDWREEIAPIGILWTWGGWDDLSWFDSLRNLGPDTLSSKNLDENWSLADYDIQTDDIWNPLMRSRDASMTKNFMFVFKPK